MNNSLKLAAASIIYRYSTRRLSPTGLVRFFYALKGRDSHSGVLKKTNSRALAKGLILSPEAADKELQAFFKFWKCPIKRTLLRPPVEDKLAKEAAAFKNQHKQVSDILLINNDIYVLYTQSRPEFRLASYKIHYFDISGLFKPENKKKLEVFSKGISLTSPKPRSSHILFLYSAKALNKTDKVRFYYALKGRDGKSGILKQTASEFLVKGVLLTPIEHASQIQDFLRDWHCEQKKMEVITASHE